MTTSSRHLGVLAALIFIGGVVLMPLKTHAVMTALVKPPNNLGLVGYWSFDEGSGTVATDFSGNGNHGTLTNGPAWVNGKRGEALNFAGDVDAEYVDAGTGIVATGAVTACAWVNANSFSLSGFEDVIVAKGSSDLLHTQYALASGAEESTTQKSIEFFWSNDAGSYEVYATTDTIHVGEWHHICGTRTSGGSGSIYIDGTSRSVTPSGDVSVTTDGNDTVAIGRAGAFDGYYWDGVLDEVRIYNRALSASEVTALYDSGAVKLGASSVDLQRGSTLANGLVGHWTFDGPDVTTTVTDRSGQGNNGYFIGTATSSAKTIGKLGQALSFNGVSNNFVTVKDSASLDITGTLTLSAWIKANSLSGFRNILGKVDEAGDTNNFHFTTDANQLQLWFCPNSGGDCVPSDAGNETTNANLTTGVWHHVAVTYSDSANSIVFYVDGVAKTDIKIPEAANSGETTSMFANNSPLFVGQAYSGSTFNGIIDDARVYNRALTASEVKQLYNLGKATIQP